MKKSMILAMSMLSTPAFAGGFGLKAQSAKALGSAMAGVQADRATPGSAYYNPASIVGVDGAEGSLTVFGVIVDSGYQNATGALLGGVSVQGAASGESVTRDAVIPDGTIAARVNDRFFVALALNAPYGFDASYADDSVLRYHGTSSMVMSASLTPIVGMALSEEWAIAGGVRFEYMSVDFDGAIDAAGIAAAMSVPGFIPGADDVTFELDADDISIGYVFGVQGEISPRLRVGASFTSKIEHDYYGDADFDIGDSVAGQLLAGAGLFQDTRFTSSLTGPAAIQFGGAYEVTPSFTLLASAVLTRWSRFAEIEAVFDNPAQPPELVTQNWRDTWTWSVGAEAALSPSDTARLGVMFEETPVNDAFASPRIPDADRVWAGGGMSHKLGDRATLNLAAAYLFIGDRAIDQPASRSENFFRGAAQADIESDSVIVSLGIDLKF